MSLGKRFRLQEDAAELKMVYVFKKSYTLGKWEGLQGWDSGSGDGVKDPLLSSH